MLPQSSLQYFVDQVTSFAIFHYRTPPSMEQLTKLGTGNLKDTEAIPMEIITNSSHLSVRSPNLQRQINSNPREATKWLLQWQNINVRSAISCLVEDQGSIITWHPNILEIINLVVTCAASDLCSGTSTRIMLKVTGKSCRGPGDRKCNCVDFCLYLQCNMNLQIVV